jgi:hypothetical protein
VPPQPEDEEIAAVGAEDLGLRDLARDAAIFRARVRIICSWFIGA